MVVFAIGIENSLDVPVQRFHDTNPPIRRAVTFGHQFSIQMEAYGGPAQPSPTISQCLNGGYR
jgi:hypothetical protein